MPVRAAHLSQLQPYLVGEAPNSEGEWAMHCPLHHDSKRSASLNVKTGAWFCQAGCGGGRIQDLIRRKDEWVSPKGSSAAPAGDSGDSKAEAVSEAQVQGWAAALLGNDDRLDWLIDRRGLTTSMIERFEIGWDRDRKVYTIPVRGRDKTLYNLRRYNPTPTAERRKIWGLTKMNTPRLYPLQVLTLETERVIICEGEWDALVTIQNGYPAITRTGAAKVWRPEWSKEFNDKIVYVCHDMDTMGQTANRFVARSVARYAREVRVIQLPYEIVAKHGKDLTDFWLEHDASDFEALLAEAEPFISKDRKRGKAPEIVTVLESFDSRKTGVPVQLVVTIKGKREPGYTIPRIAKLTCSKDVGAKCAACPMNATLAGEDCVTIEPDDPVALELIEATSLQLFDVIRRAHGSFKCNRLEIEVTDHQAVEQLYARPSLDHSDGTKAGQYRNIKITSVGHHDTLPNNTVRVTGALHPNPRNQMNEFLAWEIARQETGVDSFEMTPEIYKVLQRFQAGKDERPLRKLADISKQLSSHVTKIYGRPEMHALMDLVFHSPLAFKFANEVVFRGWLEALILGDTRTGKSEAAARLVRHYRAGEIVAGESASLAGIVGGLQQFGSGKEWAVTWGLLPINDQRLVVIDEASGLSTDDISKMSDIRASGIARLTKIQQEVTYARTRGLWLSNPRGARMADFTYGVQALGPLIGNAEDIARFDVVMCISIDDVPAEEINKAHEVGDLPYTSDACATLVRWVWTRKVDQIKWTKGAEQAVYEAALDLGRRYTEDPPLLQAANARIKVARLAAAMAARLFSTDKTGEHIVVTKEHVVDAVAFLDRLYKSPVMGYADHSREVLRDQEEAGAQADNVKQYLRGRAGLAKFLRTASRFRRQDLEEIMNVDRTEANAIINTLWECRMVRKEGGDVRVESSLVRLLREEIE